MHLTDEILANYVGGQLEVQNKSEGYIFRGEIKTAILKDKDIQIALEWMAKGEGYPPLPERWVADNKPTYEANLEIYSVSNIGPGSEGDDRICLSSPIVGETTILYPPNGSKLDRCKIEENWWSVY
jgi:hypothetical protein